jgi:ATP adenylyltransferase
LQNVERLIIPGITDPSTLTCIARARKYSQYLGMVKNALTGVCPFCTPDPVKNPRIELSAGKEHWYITHCNPPEDFTRVHLLYIPIKKIVVDGAKRHVKDTRELSKEAWADLQDVHAEATDRFRIPYRGWQCRDGDARESVGTIEHLHIHVMAPDGTGRVESPLSKTPEEEESLQRTLVFEKMRQGASVNDLEPHEANLVQGRI